MSRPAWLEVAYQEMARGVREVSGAGANPRILEYLRGVIPGERLDETPWCAAFVGWCLTQAGITPSKSALARSYLKWGIEAQRTARDGQPAEAGTVRHGAIVVLRRGASKWQGHVGFYVGENRQHVLLLGGNQGDEVNVSSYPRERILGMRWPA